MNFAANIVSDPVTIRLRREEESLDNVKQVRLAVRPLLTLLRSTWTAPPPRPSIAP